MKIRHTRTVIDRVVPVIIPPPCAIRKDRKCLECSRLGKCESPVSWCALPYYDKKKGCPKFNSCDQCPPNVQLFDEVYETDFVTMVACGFDLGFYLREMQKAHPDWNERQLRNVIYWQSQARKVLEEATEKRLSTFREDKPCYSPEAMGVDLAKTASQIGVLLDFPPTKTVWRIALIAKEK